jgi:hypothetical protein
MAGVGSAVNDTTRNMGSVLGVAVFGSIAASVFASRMPGSAGSIGAVAAAAHHAGGAYGSAVLHEAASAFVAGADRAVLAGVIAAVAGALVAFRAFRPVRASVPAEVPVPAGVPAEERVPAGASRG